MTNDDIVRMAREAEAWSLVDHDGIAALERFANLVAAAERERIKWDSIHSCHADCQNPACVIVREAVAAEREACAKVVEEWLHGEWHNQGVVATTMIRARGQV